MDFKTNAVFLSFKYVPINHSYEHFGNTLLGLVTKVDPFSFFWGKESLESDFIKPVSQRSVSKLCCPVVLDAAADEEVEGDNKQEFYVTEISISASTPTKRLAKQKNPVLQAMEKVREEYEKEKSKVTASNIKVRLKERHRVVNGGVENTVVDCDGSIFPRIRKGKSKKWLID